VGSCGDSHQAAPNVSPLEQLRRVQEVELSPPNKVCTCLYSSATPESSKTCRANIAAEDPRLQMSGTSPARTQFESFHVKQRSNVSHDPVFRTMPFEYHKVTKRLTSNLLYAKLRAGLVPRAKVTNRMSFCASTKGAFASIDLGWLSSPPTAPRTVPNQSGDSRSRPSAKRLPTAAKRLPTRLGGSFRRNTKSRFSREVKSGLRRKRIALSGVRVVSTAECALTKCRTQVA
jgi:hypothetical protein